MAAELGRLRSDVIALQEIVWDDRRDLSSYSVTTRSHARRAPQTVSALASVWQIRDAAELDLHVTGR